MDEFRGRLWQGARGGWRTIARGSGIAALAGIVIGEVLGWLFNGGHNTFFIHLVSLVLAIVMAYGAAVTIGVVQGVRGLFTTLSEAERRVNATWNRATGHVVEADPLEGH
jgi:hypothetical protein